MPGASGFTTAPKSFNRVFYHVSKPKIERSNGESTSKSPNTSRLRNKSGDSVALSRNSVTSGTSQMKHVLTIEFGRSVSP